MQFSFSSSQDLLNIEYQVTLLLKVSVFSKLLGKYKTMFIVIIHLSFYILEQKNSSKCTRYKKTLNVEGLVVLKWRCTL